MLNRASIERARGERRTRGQRLLGVVALLVLGVAAACATTAHNGAASFADLYRQGLDAFAAGRADEAERAFRAAVKLNPRHPYPHYYLGVLYADAGKPELAIVAFERAIELEPSFREAIYNLGTIRLERREYVAAAKLLERAIRLDPDDVAAYDNLGKAYFLAGLLELAGAAYEEALARDPGDRVALANLAALARAAGDADAEAGYRARLAEPSK